MKLYAYFTRISKNKYVLLNDIYHSTFSLFRDHCWVFDVEPAVVDPRFLYEFNADLWTYHHGLKHSLHNLTHIKEPNMAIKATKTKNTTILTITSEVVDNLQINFKALIPAEVSTNITSEVVKGGGVRLLVHFDTPEEAEDYKKFINSEKKNYPVQELLTKLPIAQIEQAIESFAKAIAEPEVEQINSVTEYLVEVNLTKSVKVFKQYPLIEKITVQGLGPIHRQMLQYNGKRCKATFNGVHYDIDGVKFQPNYITIINEKLQGEIITSAVMAPENFVRILDEYIVTAIHGKEIKVHQSLIPRHGEVFEVEEQDGQYFEKGHTLPIPVELLNIRTIRT